MRLALDQSRPCELACERILALARAVETIVAQFSEASSASERSIIERNAIALLSRDAQLSAVLPNGWLGEHSPRREIRGSRLWNLNYVDDKYDPGFLTLLERSVGYTLASLSGS